MALRVTVGAANRTMLTKSLPGKALFRFGGWFSPSQALTPLPAALGAGLLAVLFVAPVLLAALILQEARPALWIVLILDLVVLFLFALATLRQPVLFVGVLVLWFALQRLVVALIAPHVSAETVRLLLTYKEGFYFILLAAGAGALVIRYRRREAAFTPVLAADLLAIAFMLLLAVEFLVSSEELSPKLTYGRRFVAPLLLYLGGRLLLADRHHILSGLRLVILVGLAVALFGLIERFVLSVSFWSDRVDAMAFYSKQAEGGLLPASWVRLFEGLPEGVFSAFPLDVPVRRLVSTFLEPTTLGSYLAFVLVILLFVPGLTNGRSRIAWSMGGLILAAAVAATVSRGGMEIALIAGAFILVFTGLRLLRRSRWVEAAVIVLVAVFLLSTLTVTSLSFSQFPNRRAQVQDFLSSEYISGFPSREVPPTPPPGERLDPGAQAHVNGLITGLEKMWEEPLGAGLGAAGGWSKAPEVGSESTVGTLAAQLGAPGLVLWLAFHLALVASLAHAALRLRRVRQTMWSDLLMALVGALLGLSVIAWFSESASGLLGNALYFLFAGWAISVVAPTASRLQFRWLPIIGRAGEGS